jgi:nondiscriminating aspartyl-tRNA synthetase
MSTGGAAGRSRIWSDGLRAHVGERVEIAGWLQHQRQLAKVSFALVRDARGIAQAVVEDAALRTQVAALGAETVLKVEGTVVAVAQAPGGLELHQPAVTVITAPTSPPPFELRRPQLDIQLPTLLDYAAVAWRHPRQRAVGNLAAASVAGFRRHLDGLGFVEIQTPKLVASATEGGANVFRVDYFGRDAYLAQSPQFYKQAMVGVHERVYEVGPVFRAEPHDTARHLAEYVSLDLEMGFIEDHHDVMGCCVESWRRWSALSKRGLRPRFSFWSLPYPRFPCRSRRLTSGMPRIWSSGSAVSRQSANSTWLPPMSACSETGP